MPDAPNRDWGLDMTVANAAQIAAEAGGPVNDTYNGTLYFTATIEYHTLSNGNGLNGFAAFHLFRDNNTTEGLGIGDAWGETNWGCFNVIGGTDFVAGGGPFPLAIGAPEPITFRIDYVAGGNDTLTVNFRGSQNVRTGNFSFDAIRARAGNNVASFSNMSLSADVIADVDTDGDGHSDFQELAAGTDPNSSASKPSRYLQKFNTFADGANFFQDGSKLESNNGIGSVQNGALRLTEAGNNGAVSVLRLPPLYNSSQGWTASFDVRIRNNANTGNPADGVGFSYGALPAAGFPNPAEEGWPGIDNHVSYELDSYDDNGVERGVNIAEQQGGNAQGDLGFVNGTILEPGTEVAGTVLCSWRPDPSRPGESLVSFSTTGLVTDAAFANLEALLDGSNAHTFSLAARTGGLNQGLRIDNLSIVAGSNPDTDADNLPDAWEYGQIGNLVQTGTSNPDGDGFDNFNELANGTSPVSADSDGDGLSDSEEVNVHNTPPNVADPDLDTIADGEEVTAGTDGFVTNPFSADTDGDGYSDSQEIDDGSDPTNPASIPTPGLVLYYPFDVQNGTVVENAGSGGTTGAILGGGTYTTGQSAAFGTAFLGNRTGGNEARVETGLTATQLGLLAEYTAMAWVRWDGSSGDQDQMVFGQVGGNPQLHHGLRLNGGGTDDVHFGHWGNDVDNAGSVTQGVWVHLAWSWDGLQGRTYVNGVEAPNFDGDIEGPLSAAAVGKIVAIAYSDLGGSFNGAVDEVKIFAGVLNAAAIVAEMVPPGPPVAGDDVVTMHHNGKVRIEVLANDFGGTVPASVQVITPPSHGTATASADGSILYSHGSGTPPGDTFRYRVNGPQAGDFSEADVLVTFASAARIASGYADLPTNPPPTTLAVANAFPGIGFNTPHDLAILPGTRALIVTEADGRIQVIEDTLAPAKTLFLDITNRVFNDGNEQAMKGVAVHPQWPAQPYIFVTYNINVEDGLNSGVRLMRFTTTTSPPYTANPASEIVLIEQDCDNNGFVVHTIGTPEFGADGYLYVGFGDESESQVDDQNNSQHIDRNVWSGVIRIDVDKKPGNLDPNPDPSAVDPETGALPPGQLTGGDLKVTRLAGGGATSGPAHYKIPIDNPFVHSTLGGPWNGSFNGRTYTAGGAPGQVLGAVRNEFYNVGTRNPWQIYPIDDNADNIVDVVAVGDVGNGALEEITFAQAGANLGWGWLEGNQGGVRAGQTLNNANQGAATLKAPDWQYPHGGGSFSGNSVTCGFLYRGSAHPQLTGKLIAADFSSGNIWSIERTAGAPVIERIAGENSITALCFDPTTEGILFADRDGGIRRLVTGSDSGDFPPTLSSTGFFADLSDLSPNPGAVAYDVNLRFWSDNADKSRWFLIKNTTDEVGFSPTGNWTFPSGMIWVKHFDFELTPGNPATKRRLETRFLVKNDLGAYGVTYRWNHILDGQPQTEAFLVGPAGADLVLPVDHDANPVTPATNQTWRFPARSECMTCHNEPSGRALSFNTRQLNRDGSLAGTSGNFLTLLASAAYLDQDPGPPSALQRHIRPDETAYSLEARVRSWLDVNCAYCHLGAGSTAPPSWDGRLHRTLDQTNLINGFTLEAPLDPADRLIVPGQVDDSIIRHRMAGTGGYTRMPPLATSVVDAEAVQLIEDYINSEASDIVSYDDFRQDHFGGLVSAEGARGFDADGDGQTNEWEWLTNTDPKNNSDRWTPTLTPGPTGVTVSFPGLGNRSVTVWRSTALTTWEKWNVDLNDGIPLNPATDPQFLDDSGDPKAFFRFGIEER